MTEISIELSELSLQDFYGENNNNLKVIKTHFPKLKIVGRDQLLFVQGNEEALETFEEKILKIIDFLRRYNRLSVKDIEDLILDPAKELQLTDDVIVFGMGGKPIKAQTINQKRITESIKEKDLVFVSGPAGTGKTYICVAMAVRALKNKEVKKIILTRPAVEAGERIGFLPGDFKEKLDPYIQPLYDALKDMLPLEKLSSYIEKGIVEIVPLAFMRGRTLDNAFVILDEAQNTTTHQMKMFLTRMGKNAKFVITGDPRQKDLDTKYASGLAHALSLLSPIEGVAMVELTEVDVQRHRLVSQIIKAYEK